MVFSFISFGSHLGIPGIFFLLAATILLVITSISLPFLDATDLVRTHFNHQHPTSPGDGGSLTEVRVSLGLCVVGRVFY